MGRVMKTPIQTFWNVKLKVLNYFRNCSLHATLIPNLVKRLTYILWFWHFVCPSKSIRLPVILVISNFVDQVKKEWQTQSKYSVLHLGAFGGKEFLFLGSLGSHASAEIKRCIIFIKYFCHLIHEKNIFWGAVQIPKFEYTVGAPS